MTKREVLCLSATFLKNRLENGSDYAWLMMISKSKQPKNWPNLLAFTMPVYVLVGLSCFTASATSSALWEGPASPCNTNTVVKCHRLSKFPLLSLWHNFWSTTLDTKNIKPGKVCFWRHGIVLATRTLSSTGICTTFARSSELSQGCYFPLLFSIFAWTETCRYVHQNHPCKMRMSISASEVGCLCVGVTIAICGK